MGEGGDTLPENRTQATGLEQARMHTMTTPSLVTTPAHPAAALALPNQAELFHAFAQFVQQQQGGCGSAGAGPSNSTQQNPTKSHGPAAMPLNPPLPPSYPSTRYSKGSRGMTGGFRRYVYTETAMGDL